MSRHVKQMPPDGRGRNNTIAAFAGIEKFLDGKPWLVSSDEIPPGGVGCFLAGLRRRATKKGLRIIGRTGSDGQLYVQAKRGEA